jgi:hypothetical protein
MGGDVIQVCRDVASRLLDFYINGTLSGSERDRVAAHVDRCPVCAREVAEIEKLRQLLAETGTDLVGRPLRRSRRLLWAATVLAVVVLLGIWIGARPGSPPTREASSIATLDLGAGETRGGLPPSESIAEDVVYVELVFSLTVEPGATYTMRLFDPRGRRVFGPAPITAWDAVGSARHRFPIGVFAIDGEYRLEVEESSAGGTHYLYDYVFTIRVKR